MYVRERPTLTTLRLGLPISIGCTQALRELTGGSRRLWLDLPLLGNDIKLEMTRCLPNSVLHSGLGEVRM